MRMNGLVALPSSYRHPHYSLLTIVGTFFDLVGQSGWFLDANHSFRFLVILNRPFQLPLIYLDYIQRSTQSAGWLNRQGLAVILWTLSPLQVRNNSSA